MGWFYGFKQHAIINLKGELICLKLTLGHVDDRKPTTDLCQELFGQLLPIGAIAFDGSLKRWLSKDFN